MKGTPSRPSALQRPVCCGSQRRAGVIEYFDLGLRRSRARQLPTRGATCVDSHGLRLQYGLRVGNGRIDDVSFRVTTCVTLVAYAELLAQRVRGLPLRDAMRLTAVDLVRQLEQVPPAKQDRAVLAVRALQSAIVRATRAGFADAVRIPKED